MSADQAPGVAMAQRVSAGTVVFGNDLPLVLIAGPCQLESRAHALECAAALCEIAKRAGMPFVFKTSFDKANRTSVHAPRGIGFRQAPGIFAEIRERFGVPVLTDVHNESQCAPIAEVVDILQIPAFLARQTDLLLAAGRTGAVVNIKKAQFMAPGDIVHAAEKVASVGNTHILLTERGASFGYNNLVVDMRSFPIMKATGYPVIFDATHAVQNPGALGLASGGDRAMVPVLAKAAVATGIAGLFIEAHPDPDRAPSDAPCMLPIHGVARLIETIMAIDVIAKRDAGTFTGED
jgi:2-dehydro-3-deoxyphosphooctonate aldolase (KDO 8-P synthase)